MGRRMTKEDGGLGKGHQTGPVRTTGAFRNLVFLGKMIRSSWGEE